VGVRFLLKKQLGNLFIMKTILGDQSPWNGGLLRAQALRNAGHDVTYQIHDADTVGVSNDNMEGARVRFGNPPYYALASRLPLGSVGLGIGFDDSKLQAVLQSCRTANPGALQRASVHPVAYVQSRIPLTIRGGMSSPDVRDVVKILFEIERCHLSLITGKVDLPQVSTIGEALLRFGEGITPSSITEMFHDAPPLLLDSLDENCFWGIDQEYQRLPYTADRSDWYAVVPKAYPLILELSLRGYAIAYTNCAYKGAVMKLRDQKAKGHKINALQVLFDWQHDLLDLDTPFTAAWKKKGQPDYSSIFKYWAGRPTSMGLLALGGELNPRFEEMQW
jgi:hypothetical protein